MSARAWQHARQQVGVYAEQWTRSESWPELDVVEDILDSLDETGIVSEIEQVMTGGTVRGIPHDILRNIFRSSAEKMPDILYANKQSFYEMVVRYPEDEHVKMISLATFMSAIIIYVCSMYDSAVSVLPGHTITDMFPDAMRVITADWGAGGIDSDD